MTAELNPSEQKLIDDGVICPCSLGLECADCEAHGHTSDCCGQEGCAIEKEHFHDKPTA
jgi:hypothetical protein